jgi:hypothetical protein
VQRDAAARDWPLDWPSTVSRSRKRTNVAGIKIVLLLELVFLKNVFKNRKKCRVKKQMNILNWLNGKILIIIYMIYITLKNICNYGGVCC